ncbi:MAG: uroporphyrinogen decarboxylase family protein [Victivallales bacterium]
MTSSERLRKVLRGEIPDCVPAAPDFSNMIPAKMTGKPFWDLYLYNDPPIWEAYVNCAKFFEIDTLMDGYFPLRFAEETANEPPWKKAIVSESAEMIITRDYYVESGKTCWKDTADVFYKYDPPTRNIKPEKLNLPPAPPKWRPVENIKPVDCSPDGYKKIKQLIGERGLAGVWVSSTGLLTCEEDIFAYYDNPRYFEKLAEEHLEKSVARFERVMAMDEKPDFICLGCSGTLVFQTPEIFRKLALPTVKELTRMAKEAGVFTHIHSCGPEKELVKIMAEETDLTVIDPLEIPPMGDCNLAELKRLYGKKLVLKGNLHTTDVMLNGTVDEVIQASRKAIDDAAEGGRFILSTGDQCGRDTPFENLHAMIETARSYGKYR